MLSAIIMGVKGSLFIAVACWLFAKLIRPAEAKWIRGTPTLLAIGIFGFGAIAHNIWIYYAVLVCLIPALAKSRAEAVALYPICLISLPDLHVYMTAGSMTITPVDKWLVFAVGLAVAIVNRPRSPGRAWGYLDIPLLLLVTLEMIQLRGDANVTSVLRDSVTPLVALLLPYYLVSRNLKSVEDIRRMVLSLTFTGFILGCIAVIEMTRHWLIYQSLYQILNVENLSASLYAKMRAGMLRAPTSFGESTSFGLYLAFMMIFCMAGRDVFRRKRNWAFALAVMFLGTVAANSRNAWIGLAIGLPLYDLYRRRFLSLTIKIGALGLAYVAVMAAAQVSPYVAAATGRSADSAGTVTYRHQLLARGMEEVHKHPWTGTSMQEALTNLADMRQGEGIIDLVNGYLGYALTAGYIGAFALLLAFVIPALVMFSYSRRLGYNRRLQRYGAAVCAIAGFSIVTTFFTGFGGTSMTFYLITLAIGTAVLSIERPPRRPKMQDEPVPAVAEPALAPA